MHEELQDGNVNNKYNIKQINQNCLNAKNSPDET